MCYQLHIYYVEEFSEMPKCGLRDLIRHLTLTYPILV